MTADVMAILNGHANGWENITPARRYVPREIRELERQLVEAEAEHDTAHDVHEQAYTEATRDNLEDTRAAMQAIVDELERLREIWHSHPERFGMDEGEVV